MKKLSLLLILVMSLNSFSQLSESYFGAHGIFSIPMGEFKESDDINTEGFSLPGFGFGVDYNIPLGHPAINFLAELQFLTHFVDQGELEENLLFSSLDNFDVGNYFSFPILIGIKGKYSFTDILGIYGTGQFGFSVQGQSDMDGEYNNEPVETDFSPDVTFTWGFCAGITIKKKLSFGIRFLSLGKPEFEYEVSSSVQFFNYKNKRQFTMNTFQFLVGWDF